MEKSPLAQPADIPEALALLTRLPVPSRFARGGAAAWAWPLAGLAVALIAIAVGGLASGFGLSAPIAAGLVLASQILVTGALHEDGLADSADGLWGGQTRARRLEIMKDSRIGTYGVLALGLSLLLRWAALTALIQSHWLIPALIATGLLSRAPMAVLAASLPNARGEGLAQSVGRPGRDTALLAVGLALLGALLAVGWAVLAPVLWVALATIAVAALARARIGGQTGDILGASQQLAEIAALCALAAIA